MRNSALFKNYAIELVKLKNKLLYKNKVLKNSLNNTKIDFPLIKEYNENRLLGYQPSSCNAPFSSLYFGVNGEVYACCKNRSYVLGNVEKQSIKEIWEGSKIVNLREKLIQYDFESGCLDCQSDICHKKYANLMASAYDTMDVSGTMNYPARIDFELSSTCNLACIMCNESLSTTYRKHFLKLPPLKEHYGEKFVREIDEFLPYLKKANFLGGEPFLIDIYYTIWDALISKNPNCNIHLQTNGHILNNKVKEVLNKGKFSIGMSLESLKKEKFEKIRLYGSYNRFMENFTYFKEYCSQRNTHFNIAVSPIIDTIDEIPDFIEFANKEGIFIYLNTVTEPYQLSIWSMKPEVISTYIKQFEKITFPDKKPHEKSNIEQFKSYLNQLYKWEKEARERENTIQNLVDNPIEKIEQLLIEKLLLETPKWEGYTTEDRENYFTESLKKLKLGNNNYKQLITFLYTIENRLANTIITDKIK